jgi:hypothetical protein
LKKRCVAIRVRCRSARWWARQRAATTYDSEDDLTVRYR